MNNSIFACLLLLLLSNASIAQSDVVQKLIDQTWDEMHNKSKADSLAHKAYEYAKAQNEYSGQFNGLQVLGRIQEYHSENDSALIYYKRAQTLAAAENNRSDLARVLIDLAYLKERKGDRLSAVSLIEQSLEYYVDLKDTFKIGKTHNILGYFYSNGGNHKMAAINILKALEIAELQNDIKRIASASQGVGIIYNKQNDFDKAEKYFHQAMNAFGEAKDTAGMIAVHNDFGILNKNKGNFLEAESHYFKMLQYADRPKFEFAEKTASNNLGVLYYKMKMFEKGIEYCSRGATIAQAEKDMRSESAGLNYLAKNQLGLGLSKAAIVNAKRSLQLAQEAMALEKERDATLTLSEAYGKVNNNELALSFFKEHKLLYDSIFNEEKTEQIHSLEQKYESEKKDKEITLLAQKVALDQVKKTRLWLAIGATLLLAGLLFWIQWLRQIKQKEVELGKRKLIELENQRLSQELDFKKQELTSKVLQLCQKNEFLQSLEKQVKEFRSALDGEEARQAEKLSRQISRDLDIDNNWAHFLKSFESVHPDFNKKINNQHPGFSAGERRMSCLLRMNLGTKEIANLLNITTEGVKKTKYRMRKKMAIDPALNFTSYFMNLDVS